MLKIVYSEDTGLYTDIIMVMANSIELRDFMDTLHRSKFIKFQKIEDAEVSFTDECCEFGAVCIRLEELKLFEIAKICKSLLNFPRPAHNYIDLDGGYTLMISKDEYHK